MEASLTGNGKIGLRVLLFVSGLGMVVASIMTIRHFFMANYPQSIFQGSFCDINAFFNCDSSAFSSISQIHGVPLGYFGLVAGALLALSAVFPSPAFERTNKTISALNAAGVISLFLFSVLYLKSLCLLCSGYYVFSLLSFGLFVAYGIGKNERGWLRRWFRPSGKHAAAFAVLTAAGAWGMILFHDAKIDAQTGVAARVVKEYFSLPTVRYPSFISPSMTAKATDRFEDAPIQVVEYADFRCPDCLYLARQLAKLKEEFKGKLNIAFQFFPLEAKCNDVVDKDKHPGACDLSYIAAYDPARFPAIHDEIWANFDAGRSPAWRLALAQKYGAEKALSDPATKELVQKIIETGREYEKTSDKYPYGIRSTPTMIINNRMVIGTLPYVQLRAIFQALAVERGQGGEKGFIEQWVQ